MNNNRQSRSLSRQSLSSYHPSLSPFFLSLFLPLVFHSVQTPKKSKGKRRRKKCARSACARRVVDCGGVRSGKAVTVLAQLQFTPDLSPSSFLIFLIFFVSVNFILFFLLLPSFCPPATVATLHISCRTYRVTLFSGTFFFFFFFFFVLAFITSPTAKPTEIRNKQETQLKPERIVFPFFSFQNSFFFFSFQISKSQSEKKETNLCV